MPFGFGLSYTTFSLALTVPPRQRLGNATAAFEKVGRGSNATLPTSAAAGVRFELRLTNAGRRTGESKGVGSGFLVRLSVTADEAAVRSVFFVLWLAHSNTLAPSPRNFFFETVNCRGRSCAGVLLTEEHAKAAVELHPVQRRSPGWPSDPCHRRGRALAGGRGLGLTRVRRRRGNSKRLCASVACRARRVSEKRTWHRFLSFLAKLVLSFLHSWRVSEGDVVDTPGDV